MVYIMTISFNKNSSTPPQTQPKLNAKPSRKKGLLALLGIAALGIYLNKDSEVSVGKPCINSLSQNHSLNGLDQSNSTSLIHSLNNSVFKNIFPTQKAEFGNFLDTIFPQVDRQKFNILIDDIMRCHQTDAEIYSQLKERIGEAQGSIIKKTSAIFRSISDETKAVSTQVKKAMGQKEAIDGYVEIGYPGRYVRALKDNLKISGTVIAINDEQRLTDYVQAGFPLPYDRFVSLNDYQPISKDQIPSSSVDMVTCFIGLHHVPKEKLDAFIQSIRRILRPGGSFILKDHDAHNTSVKQLSSMAHSVFNAGTGASVQEEMNEVRNFQSLNEWIALLKKHGFEQRSEPQIRENDPTKNSLVRFEKIAVTAREKALFPIKQAANIAEYERPSYQTYLTSIEWHDVAVAHEYAKCLKTPNASFPYFEHIKQYRNIVANSIKAAQENSPGQYLPSSDYTFMNRFISTKTTLEYGIKGVKNAILKPFAFLFSSETELTPMQKCAAEEAEQYANFIEQAPFYQFPYWNNSKEYWRVFKNHPSFNNLITAVSATGERVTKAVASFPIGGFYTSETNKEPETIQLIVKDPNNELLETNGVKVLKSMPNNQFKLVKIPRYRPFTEFWKKAATTTKIKAVEIAGQKKIQVKVRIDSSKTVPENIKGCKALHEWPILSDPEHKYAALNVDVKHLSSVLKTLNEQQIEISYIHDF